MAILLKCTYNYKVGCLPIVRRSKPRLTDVRQPCTINLFLLIVKFVTNVFLNWDTSPKRKESFITHCRSVS